MQINRDAPRILHHVNVHSITKLTFVSGFCQRHGPICPSRIQTSKISDPISTVSEIVHELSCDNVSDTCTTLGTGDNVPATNASGNQEGILASSISIDATTDTNQPASLLLLSDTLPESPEKIVLPDKIGVEETICDPTIRVPDSSLRVGVKASIVDTMTSASTSRKTTSFFEFQFGEEKNSKFSGVATLIPLRKTALSQEIIDMSSFNWTKIITNEKFERAQLEFRGGFKDTTLSCVLGVEVSSRLDLKLEPYRKDAFGCILERWEFLFLIHKSHFIYPIMVQECSSSLTEDNNIEESNSILIKCQYFLLGFSRGWRSTQKKPTLSNIPQKKKLKPSQEFSKSNYIIKDFGKAKLLTQPVILTPTTTIISSGLRKDNSSTHGGQLSKGGTRDSQQQRKPKQPKIISEGDASYGTSIKNEQITHDQSISNKIDLSSTSISINPLSNEYHGHSHFGQVVACEGNFANEMIPLHEMEYGISDLTSVPYDSLEHQN